MSTKRYATFVISVLIASGAFAQFPALANKPTLIDLERKAKEDPVAARDLGLRYLKGLGVAQDEKKGVMWLEIAAKQGDQTSATMLYRSFSDPKSKFYNKEKAKELEPLVQRGPTEDRKASPEPVKKAEPEAKTPREKPAPLQARWPTEDLPRALPKSGGSGFAVNKNGVFTTNFHVVHGCQVIVVEYQEMRARAKLIAVSEADDLAILEVPGKTESFLSLRNGNGKLGEGVRVSGFPGGNLKISQGIIASTLGDSMLQVSASFSSGNSGGPVVDVSGSVIGVAVEKAPPGLTPKGNLRGDDYNFAITSTKLRALLQNSRIEHSTTQGVKPMSGESAANLLKQSSAMILCYR